MKIEVSDGEIVDKYSILCLKLDKIKNEEKRKQIQHEKNFLHEHAIKLIEKWLLYYDLLSYVNRKIWDKTDEMKTLSPSNATFAYVAHEIFSLNDQRFRFLCMHVQSSAVLPYLFL